MNTCCKRCNQEVDKRDKSSKLDGAAKPLNHSDHYPELKHSDHFPELKHSDHFPQAGSHNIAHTLGLLTLSSPLTFYIPTLAVAFYVKSIIAWQASSGVWHEQ